MSAPDHLCGICELGASKSDAPKRYAAGKPMNWLLRFFCVAASYAALLSLIANPGIGAIMTACLFFLIFCSLLSAVERIITTNEYVSFVATNAILILVIASLHFGSTQATNFSFYLSGEARWIKGYPTWRGILDLSVFAVLCVVCNAIGVAAHHVLRNRFSISNQ